MAKGCFKIDDLCSAMWKDFLFRQNDRTDVVSQNALSKVQKILRNATRSENTFQTFNIEVCEKIYLVEFLVLGA